MCPRDRSWPPPLTTTERGLLLRAADAGPEMATLALEEELRSVVGAPHAVAFNSCTSAIHAAAAVIAPMRGVRTMAPGFTFAGTWTGPAHLGHLPLFTDIDGSTWNIDEQRVARLAEEADLIVAVDLHGVPHNAPRTHVDGRAVITDACQSLGSLQNGRHVGADGLHCWSFSPGKAVPSFAGGAVTVDNEDLALRLRAARDYGIFGDGPRAAEPCVLPYGHNWRITAPDAALAAHRLRVAFRPDGWIEQMRTVGEELRLAARALGFTVQQPSTGSVVAWHKIRVGWGRQPWERLAYVFTDHDVPWHRWGLPMDDTFPWAMQGARPPLPRSRLLAGATLCLTTEQDPFWTWNDRRLNQMIEALGRAAEEMAA